MLHQVLLPQRRLRHLRTAVSDAKLAMLDAQGFHSIAQRFMRRSEAALRIVQYANQRPAKTAQKTGEPIADRGKIDGILGRMVIIKKNSEDVLVHVGSFGLKQAVSGC